MGEIKTPSHSPVINTSNFLQRVGWVNSAVGILADLSEGIHVIDLVNAGGNLL